MNTNEAKQAIRKIMAYCPAQHFDELSPAAWAEGLGDLRLVDVLEAIPLVAQEAQFIGVLDVQRKVRAIRSRRIQDYGDFEPPDDVAEDTPAYLEWLRRTRHAIADGLPVEQPPRQLTIARQVPVLTRSVDSLENS